MKRVLSIALIASLVSGCHFKKTVTNAFVRDLDTAWIVPGETTRADIDRRLGRPPNEVDVRERVIAPAKTEAIATPEREGDDGELAKRYYRWSVNTADNGRFEGGYIIVPTFAKGEERRAHDLMICFDELGVVTLVSRVENNGERIRILEWKEAMR